MGIFIEHSKLHNLKLYKYSSEDHSLISKYILKKWWNYFVNIFPMSMAPNVVTLLGLLFIVANLLCVFYYDPYFNVASPRWCYFFYAFGLFMYQTFDGCDGCHARRTGQSGPLGELFDHSIDAINTSLGILIFGSVFQIGHGPVLLIAEFAATCNFYTSTWEEYHTKTLFLSQFSGPVEGILMVVALYITTGIVGPEIWKADLFDLDLLSLGLETPITINTAVFYLGVGACSLYFNIISAVNNVNKKHSAEIPDAEEVRTRNNEAYKGLVPFFLYYASIAFYIWVYPEVLNTYCLPLLISIGCTIAFSVGRIILAHLTLSEFPMIQFPMFLPCLQLLFTIFMVDVYGYDYDKVLLAVSWLGVGVALGVHGTFICEIINEITTYLDIYTLSIKHKKA